METKTLLNLQTACRLFEKTPACEFYSVSATKSSVHMQGHMSDCLKTLNDAGITTWAVDAENGWVKYRETLEDGTKIEITLT
ncbi:MAG: hypothetical protein LBV26_09270 [Bacteroidales bacterium]|jgi:hypothetical protein|nr:hypothetical protein [Bacteroidales bacterium]